MKKMLKEMAEAFITDLLAIFGLYRCMRCGHITRKMVHCDDCREQLINEVMEKVERVYEEKGLGKAPILFVCE